MFPSTRLSRLRRTRALRNMITETNLSPSDFVCPVFVEEEIAQNIPITSMPGQFRIAEKNLNLHLMMTSRNDRFSSNWNLMKCLCMWCVSD